MEVIIKLNSQAAGRDKLARIVQYMSRFVWNELQKSNSDRYTIDQFKTLETTCSSFRKLLRFGKCVDSFYSALSYSRYPEIFVRVTLFLSKMTNSLFLFADHVIWLARSGFLKNIDSNRWSDASNRYWLYTILLNLVRDVYEIQKIILSKKGFILDGAVVSPRNLLAKYFIILRRTFSVINIRKDVVTDTVKNMCDLWIPLTALGRVKLQPGTVGLLGAISSAAALIALSYPPAKLVPV